MMLAELSPLGWTIVIGLLLLGGLSIFALANVGPRPWQRRIMSWGVGTSLGGLITMLILSYCESTFVLFAEKIVRELGLRKILPASFPFGALVPIGVLVSGMVLGGHLMWSLMNHRTRKRDEQ